MPLLFCANGEHEWDRSAQPGRLPRSCPEHRGPSSRAFAILCDQCGESLEGFGRRKRHAGACERRANAARQRAARAALPVEQAEALRAAKRVGPWVGERACRYCECRFEAKSPKAEVCYATVCQRRKKADRMRAFQKAYAEKHGKTYAHLHYPAKRAAQSQARRALARGASDATPIVKADVYERDGWVCCLCHEAIDPALTFPDPRSVSLDHRVPLSKGGAHDLDNVQSAHLSCNSSKGART